MYDPHIFHLKFSIIYSFFFDIVVTVIVIIDGKQYLEIWVQIIGLFVLHD